MVVAVDVMVMAVAAAAVVVVNVHSETPSVRDNCSDTVFKCNS